MFVFTVYVYFITVTGSRVFTIGKCADSSFEKQLLDTVAQLPDTLGGRLLPSIVQQVESDIRGCGRK